MGQPWHSPKRGDALVLPFLQVSPSQHRSGPKVANATSTDDVIVKVTIYPFAASTAATNATQIAALIHKPFAMPMTVRISLSRAVTGLSICSTHMTTSCLR